MDKASASLKTAAKRTYPTRTVPPFSRSGGRILNMKTELIPTEIQERRIISCLNVVAITYCEKADASFAAEIAIVLTCAVTIKNIV